MKAPPAPSHLQPATQAWWQSVCARWDLDPHHAKLLTLAAQAWDRSQQARELLERDGLLIEDGTRAHPAVKIEADSRIAFCRCLRELDLDIDTPAESKRPPSLRSIGR